MAYPHSTNRRRFLMYGLLGVAGVAGVGSLKTVFNQDSATKSTGAINPGPTSALTQNATSAPTLSSTPTITLAPARNPTVAENNQPGNPGWIITKTGDDTLLQIKGYASATSVNKGNAINFHVSVNPPQNYTMEIYRIGWYNGVGGRLMQTVGPLIGATETVPPPDALGTVACKWPVAYTLNVPDTWTSGVYLVKLINTEGWQNYIHFVVRDDARASDLMFQCSVTTYQAYNNFGSKSLYPDNSVNGDAARKVSFDRPYSTIGALHFYDWEMPALRFLEQSGYDVSYCTNLDLHSNPNLLDKRKAFLSTGHDEYWSMAMYDNALNARNKGKHLAFFGGNAVYWQIRLESSAEGMPDRIITCYKGYYKEDPEFPGPTTTYLWRELIPGNPTSAISRPENQLIGIMYDGFVNVPVGQSFVVANSDYWVYAGTGFSDGTSVPGIVGYEWDKRYSNGLEPAGLVQLSNSVVVNEDKVSSYSHAAIYQAASGAWVFASGTIYWCYALDFCGFQTTDLRNAGIQRATRNILNRFTSEGASSPASSGNTSKDFKITSTPSA